MAEKTTPRKRKKQDGKKGGHKQMMRLLILVFIAALGFLVWQRFGRTKGVYLKQVFDVPVETRLVAEGRKNRPGKKRNIEKIVIHETGNTSEGADAAAHAKLQADGGMGTTSWHYTVDDHVIYHSIPDDEIAWHAGDGADGDGNVHGIGIELCVNADGNFEKTFDNGAKLAGYLMAVYDLPREALTQHFDYTGKNCPQTIRETGRWEEFAAKTAEYQKQAEEQLKSEQ